MPSSTPIAPRSGSSLVHRLREATGVALAFCDQCGTCTSVCPSTEAMDLPPCRLVRLAQTGFEGFDRRVLASEAIWQCTGCELCAKRCPQDVDLPKAMAFFRAEAERLGLVRAHGAVAATIHFEGRWSKTEARTPVG
ncbi:MAG TPA: 4Fe-4S dicluster domain-containing protein [Holophagaceae bacterium]